eukprot:1011252-Amphidinium_carterae.1
MAAKSKACLHPTLIVVFSAVLQQQQFVILASKSFAWSDYTQLNSFGFTVTLTLQALLGWGCVRVLKGAIDATMILRGELSQTEQTLPTTNTIQNKRKTMGFKSIGTFLEITSPKAMAKSNGVCPLSFLQFTLQVNLSSK